MRVRCLPPCLVLILLFSAPVYGSEIRGGNSYETAVPLASGQGYQLDHHQKKGQYDYFTVDLKGGQGLTVTMSTAMKGISIRGETFQENDHPYAGFQILDANRQKIGGEELIGSPNALRSAEVTASATQRFYLLVGSGYDDMHKEATFKIAVDDYFDAGGGVDAGGTFDTAMPIEKGRVYPVNYLRSGDDADLFKLTSAKGEKLSLLILPENPASRLQAVFFDDLRIRLAEGHSPNDGAGVPLLATASSTTTYLKVERFLSDKSTKYSIAFEGAVPAETMPSETQPVGPETVPAETLPAFPKAETRPAESQPTAETLPTVVPTVSGTMFSPPAETPPEKREEALPKIKIEKPARLKWGDPRILKALGIALGAGALIGLVIGLILGKAVWKKT